MNLFCRMRFRINVREFIICFKGCGDSYVEVNILQNLKVATNKTSTLHLTLCTWRALENYSTNDQQFTVNAPTQYLFNFVVVILLLLLPNSTNYK